MPENKKLRVWHIPQIPGEPFHVPVEYPEEAAKIIRVLGEYDEFQFVNHIKPDYANASGLEEWDEEESEWLEWYNDDGDDIRVVMDAEDGEEEED